VCVHVDHVECDAVYTEVLNMSYLAYMTNISAAILKCQEDEVVSRLVIQYGPKRWAAISKHLQGRTGKQCRER